MSDCPACRIVQSRHRPPGGLVARAFGFVIHGVDAPTPFPGWIVVTSERHLRGVYDFSADEWSSVGPLLGRLMQLQRAALGAEHVYLFAIGDLLHHAHLHLVPRYATTPQHLRGRGVFDAKAHEHIDEREAEAAVDVLRRTFNDG